MYKLHFAVMLTLSLCISGAAFSTTHYVNPGESIQDVIETAVDEDTIIVKPGIFYENINTRGKAITLMSEAGADSTIIDGLGLTVVTIDSGEDSRTIIDGLTLQYGYPRPEYIRCYSRHEVFTRYDSGVVCSTT